MANATDASRDSRLRMLKHQLAAAEADGDTDAAEAARRGIAEIRDGGTDRKKAAVARADAAGDGEPARTKAPQGRTAPAKAQTTAGPAKATTAKD